MASDILVVDDEHDIREIVAGILSDEGHETRMAHDSDSALAAISDRVPRLVFLDIWMQGSKLDGLSLLDEIKTRHPELPVVMISGHGDIETAVSAIKRGAFDFIEKPFKADRLILIAERALENSKLKRENIELKRRAGDAVELIGTSVAGAFDRTGFTLVRRASDGDTSTSDGRSRAKAASRRTRPRWTPAPTEASHLALSGVSTET